MMRPFNGTRKSLSLTTSTKSSFTTNRTRYIPRNLLFHRNHSTATVSSNDKEKETGVNPLAKQYYELSQQWMKMDSATADKDDGEEPMLQMLHDGTIVRREMRDAFLMVKNRFENYEQVFQEEFQQREALEEELEEEEEREEKRVRRQMEKRRASMVKGRANGLLQQKIVDQGKRREEEKREKEEDEDEDDDDDDKKKDVPPMKIAYEKMLKKERRERQMEKLMRKIGVYLTGREGIGKATMINVLTQVARVTGWNVLHVADIRKWVAASLTDGMFDEVQANMYLLSEVMRGWEEQKQLIRKSGMPNAEELVENMFCFTMTTFKSSGAEEELSWKDLIELALDPSLIKYDPIRITEQLMNHMRTDTTREHLFIAGHHEMIFESLGEASGNKTLKVPLMAKFPFMEGYPRLTPTNYKRMSVFFSSESTRSTLHHTRFMPMYKRVRPESFSLKEFEIIMSQTDLPEIISSQSADFVYTTLQSITRAYPGELNDLAKFARDHGPHKDFEDLIESYTENLEQSQRNTIRSYIRILDEDDRVLIYNDIFDFTFRFLSSRMFQKRPQIPRRIPGLLLDNNIGEERFEPDLRYQGIQRRILAPLYPITSKVLLQELAEHLPDIRADEISLRSHDLYELYFSRSPQDHKAWYIMNQRETVTREIVRCMIESTAAAPGSRYSIRTFPVSDPAEDSAMIGLEEMRKCHVTPMGDVSNVDSVFDNLPSILQELSNLETPNKEQVMVIPKTGDMAKYFDFFFHRPSDDPQRKPSLIAFKVIDTVSVSYPGEHDVDLPDPHSLATDRYESIEIVLLSLIHTKELGKRYRFLPAFADGSHRVDNVRVSVSFLEDYLYTQHWKITSRYCMKKYRKEKDFENWYKEDTMREAGKENNVDNILRGLARKDADSWMWF